MRTIPIRSFVPIFIGAVCLLTLPVTPQAQ